MMKIDFLNVWFNNYLIEGLLNFYEVRFVCQIIHYKITSRLTFQNIWASETFTKSIVFFQLAVPVKIVQAGFQY